MVMLFDNSSSLRAAASRQFEKEAAAGFFRNVMRPVDRAAIVSVSSYPELAQRLTGDVGALVRTIEGFAKPEGATALFDSVAYAAEYLRLHRGRKVLVIVSDGTDTISELDFDETLARALALNCQIYAVRTGHSDNTNLRDLAGERRLQEFAAQTGGAVYVPRNRAELRAGLRADRRRPLAAVRPQLLPHRRPCATVASANSPCASQAPRPPRPHAQGLLLSEEVMRNE